jgi:hypothetical protein
MLTGRVESGAHPMSATRLNVFATAAGIYGNTSDGGAKALTYGVSGSYLVPAAVSLWLHLNVMSS